jgi:hypothetical protein
MSDEHDPTPLDQMDLYRLALTYVDARRHEGAFQPSIDQVLADPGFRPLAEAAHALGREHRAGDGWVHEDDLEQGPDPGELRQAGYGAALKEVRDWATEAKDEAALSWVTEKTKDDGGDDD